MSHFDPASLLAVLDDLPAPTLDPRHKPMFGRIMLEDAPMPCAVAATDLTIDVR